MHKTVIALTISLFLFAACGPTGGGSETPDATPDTTADLVPDGADDVPVGPDTFEDLFWPDTPADTEDTEDDVAPDTEPDTEDIVEPPPMVLDFLSTPKELILQGGQYDYQPLLSLPGAPLLELLAGPEGMDLDENDVLRWIPTADQVGTFEVTLAATVDDVNSEQSFFLEVRAVEPEAVETVGATGGTLAASGDGDAEGPAAVIPSGSLQEDVTLEIGSLEEPLDLPGIESDPASTPVVFGPAGTTFTKPVLLQIPYGPGLDEQAEQLQVWVLQEETGVWSLASVVSRDAEKRILVVKASHFSVYQPGAPALEPDPALWDFSGVDECLSVLAATAKLSKDLSEVSVEAVTGLTPEIHVALIDPQGIEDVEALVLAEGFSGSLRAIWVHDLRSITPAGPTILASKTRIVTVAASGEGEGVLTLTNPAGDVLLQSVHPSLDGAWTDEIEPLLMGDGILSRFDVAPGLDLDIEASLYLIYKPGDASALPVAPGDLGLLVTAGASVPGYPDAPEPDMADIDCDGVLDAIDQDIAEGQPQLTGLPDGALTAVAGIPMALTCLVDGEPGDETVSWASNVETDVLDPSSGGTTGFTATEPGNHLVTCEVDWQGQAVSNTFSISVQQPIPENTAPACQIAVGDPVLVLGEATQLSATLSDEESPSALLEGWWGLMAEGAFTPSALIDPESGQNVSFAPTGPGLYQVACKAFDGELWGPEDVALIEVVMPDQNLPPEDLIILPFETTILVEEVVELEATAVDPEGEALSFLWLPGGQVTILEETETSSKVSFTSAVPGIFEFAVMVNDGTNAPITGTAKVSVLPIPGPTDEDEDGYSPGDGSMEDCDDLDAFIHPGAGEVCDNDIDEDCDGIADEGCSPPVVDVDGDGVQDFEDNCPDDQNPSQSDDDGDGIGDACDDDADNDGVLDASDNCPFTPNPEQENLEGDAQGDACDMDDDDDGVEDGADNCPAVANADQANNDGDASGDACDPDDDDDGVLDVDDNCPLLANPDQADLDGDEQGDACDDDDDDDGISDGDDNCPTVSNPTQDDTDGDGVGNACECAEDADCDDGNLCTDDSCTEADGCVNTPNTVACDDADACTAGDACLGGACIGQPMDCDDGNPCTDDICDGGICSNGPNEAPCDDGDACTEDDGCAGGTCAGQAMVCPDQHVCDDGVCTCVPACEGMACGDDGCNGSCGACPPLHSCEEDGVCVNLDEDGDGVPAAEDCDDGNPDIYPGATEICNGMDDNCDALVDGGSDCGEGHACVDGACALLDEDDDGVGDLTDNCPAAANPGQEDLDGDGAGDVCDDDDDGDGIPDATDNCPTEANVDQADADGDNVGDACECETDMDCQDGNPCTDDVCDPDSGCILTSNSKACDDEDPCTVGDICAGGACVGQILDCGDGNPCTDDSCDMGQCLNQPNDGPCEDDDPCTLDDQCATGTCIPGPTLECPDQHLCMDGECVCIPNCDGMECGDDGCGGPCGVCPEGHVCWDAACALLDADDDGVGDLEDNCIDVPNPGQEDLDGDGEGDACDDDVDGDGVPDADDNCPLKPNPGQGDGDGDGTGDACECLSAMDCDDGNPCTDDACDPDQGCMYADNEALCDDGDGCTYDDACMDGVCMGVTMPCMGADVCVDGVCVCIPSCEGMDCGDDGCDGSCGMCAEGQTCTQDGICVDEPMCGDGACEADETCESCPEDCGACEGLHCIPLAMCVGECILPEWDQGCIDDCYDQATSEAIALYQPLYDCVLALCPDVEPACQDEAVNGPCNELAQACDAASPSEESCNGIDDDLDGEVDEGCPGWPCDDDSDCAQNHQCTNGECMDLTCASCVPGEAMCLSDTEVMECVGVGDGCYEWAAMPCPDGAVCMDGMCSASDDMDGDGVPDQDDNCPTVWNPDQADSDGDGVGDACECESDTDCDDGNPCMNNTCNLETGECESWPFEGPCDDGDLCTEDDACVDGECHGAAMACPPGQACVDGVCADCTPDCMGKDCGDDGCGGSCGDCPDGMACTEEGLCADEPMCGDGACEGWEDCETCPDDCGPCGSCETDADCPMGDECNPSHCTDGECQWEMAENGTPCADGQGVCMDGGCMECQCSVGQTECQGDEVIECMDIGAGDCGSWQVSMWCEQPGSKCEDGQCIPWDVDGDGWSLEDGDCDDTDPEVNPGSWEQCDGKDNNCDGMVDGGADESCGWGNECVDGACQMIDTDDDGVGDMDDNCPETPNPDQSDIDSDGQGDACDPDDDDDGVADADDNCPTVWNAEQHDGDGNGVGDACECAGDADCDSGNPCRDDVCDPAQGCVWTFNTDPCDDGDPCSLNDQCQYGGCNGTPMDCDDGSDCTQDFCDDGACVNEPQVGMPCDDGDHCTQGDICGADGTCAGGEPMDCDDDNPCTDDTCNPDWGGCESVALDGPCDDGNACTQDDACMEGECYGEPVACPPGQHCVDGGCEDCVPDCMGKDCGDDGCGGSCGDCMGQWCSPDGFCVDPDCMECEPGGAQCIGDGDVYDCVVTDGCTHWEVIEICGPGTSCQDGMCVAADMDGDGHPSSEDCNDNNSEIYPGAPEYCDGIDNDCDGMIDGGADWDCGPGHHCEDGFCAQDDSDEDGIGDSDDNCPATHNPGQADMDGDGQGDACDDDMDGDGVSNPDDNCPLASNPDQMDGDGDGVGDACECETAADCEDGNPCTDDVCDPAEGCAWVNNAEPCDDGNLCTTGDVCQNGQCHAQWVDCDDGNECTSDQCDPDTGACVNEPEDGMPCDDGDPCTEEAMCVAGACVGGEPMDCDDGNPCTDDQCSPDGGGCESVPFEGPCDDMNACTQDDWCMEGECYGNPVDCPDGQICMDGICQECSPSCDGKECGGDGCGGYCGMCPGGSYCDGEMCVEESGLSCAEIMDCMNLCAGDPNCAQDCLDNGSPQGQWDYNNFATCLMNMCPELDMACQEDAIAGPCQDDAEVCGYGGCTPDCAGKECGDDGCGGSCGDCPMGGGCQDGTCVPPSEEVCNGVDDDLDGEVDEDFPCTWGDAEEQACGNCGMMMRECSETCEWAQWGDCEGEGPCTPGASQACPCGEQFCDDGCQWGACEIVCDAGEICVDDVCTPCVPECGSNECGDDGCGGSCGECAGGMVCSDGSCVEEQGGWGCPEIMDCMNECAGEPVCAQACLDNASSQGLDDYNNFALCLLEHCPQMDQACQMDAMMGPCQPQAEACGYGGCTPDCADKECGDDGCGGSCGSCPMGQDCQDGSCPPPSDEVCNGLDDDLDGDVDEDFPCALGDMEEQACGNCGVMTRVCSETCDWDDWTACEGEGSCAPGNTQSCPCGQQFCSAECQWGDCELVCDPGETCVDDVCTPCVPDCAWAECGDDGCGGSCGECAGGMVCTDGVCVEEQGLDCAGLMECLDFCGGDMGCVDDCLASATSQGMDDYNALGMCIQEHCPDMDPACAAIAMTGPCYAEAQACGGGAACGDELCQTQEGEDCGTCPEDCGDCGSMKPVINEIDYDQPDADGPEFVEIYNPSSQTLSLDSYKLELVNGAGGAVYDTYLLADAGAVLDPGQFLVIGAAEVLADLPDGVLSIELTGSIQNGAPDGARILATADDAFVDGIAYEGEMPGVGEGAWGAMSDPGIGSLGRCPDGDDTDENNIDFDHAPIPTPGAPNDCVCIPDCMDKQCGDDGCGGDCGICWDGDACTEDVCDGVACMYSPLDCDDDNPCTDDACDAETGCSSIPNTMPCDDGDACTLSDMCMAGACGGTPMDCDPGFACQDGVCEEVCIPDCAGKECGDDGCGGFCGSCDDGDACTVDACDMGTCSNVMLDCDDGNPCTADSCDEGMGGCLFSPVDGLPCDDGDACTIDDVCDGGFCMEGDLLNCDDGNPCTDDSCDPVTGCTYGVNMAPCDDGDACTTFDSCMAGACMGGEPVSCDDGNPCTDDSCDPATGCTAVANNAPCDDGNVCTTFDNCFAGACMGDWPLDCDDGNDCTTEYCEASEGCQYADEDDGQICNGGTGVCVGGACNFCECWMPDTYCDGDDAVSCIPDAPGGCGHYEVTENCEPGMCAGGECQG